MTGDHGKTLLLNGVGMAGGNVTAGREIQVEGEQLAAGLRAALANDDTLTADRINDLAPHD
jgi:hypothetical protein